MDRPKPLILIVDDDLGVRTSLSLLLKRADYEVYTIETPKEAIFWLQKHEPDLVVLDMNYSRLTTGEDGIFLLEQVKRLHPLVPVMLITAWGSIELAVKGMQLGAFDFITKPWDNYKLLDSISNAIKLRSRESSYHCATRAELDRTHDFAHIVGSSPQMIELLNTVARIAPTTASVLITGESGTGKELVAEAIHRNSQRREKPFVKVNLGGVSSSLFESEMFGHKRGAFTDAVAERTGRFKLADGGTIFLDEIGELDLACQVKLLRVLQEHTFEVLGESKPTHVDLRVVSATNADLKAMISQGTFREDLYYRINLIVLHVPPLRERKQDIPLLVQHFARKLCHDNRMREVIFDSSAMDTLMALPLTGNVRELRNIVERSILVAGKERLQASDLILDRTPTTTSNATTLEEIEAETIRAKMDEYNGNCTKAAQALGISRGALYRRLDKYGITYR